MKKVIKKLDNVLRSFLYETETFFETKEGERCMTSLIFLTALYIIVGNLLCNDDEVPVVTIPFVSMMIISIGIHYNEYLKQNKK